MPDRAPLRVVFDAHAITAQRSGIGEYSAFLCAALLEACGDRIALSLYNRGRIARVRSAADIEAVAAGTPEGSLYAPGHQGEILRLMKNGQADLFHAPDFFAPWLLRSVPVVATIHDVVPLAHPELLGRSKKARFPWAFRAAVAMTLRRAARVITDSAFSRDELGRLLGADPGGIDIVPLASTLRPTGAALPARVAALLPAGGYFLSVGRHDPYKGLTLLLDAYALARLEAGPAFPLLAIGGKEDARYDIRGTVARLGLERAVVFTGYIARDELSALYAHARAFVMPSLYEGFGLPPLDAMAHGVPVLCSNRASLPEVTGDAALLVDPLDVRAFADALIAVAQNDTLRLSLIRNGGEQAGRFSWHRTAQRTADVYERVRRERTTAR
ncbi:MAG: glycosyltransferase family 4 protein [Ignavibacteria bacterium]|nr:glycosyltransferase family 4 protein [Ignavibacteria bacterium]